VVAVSEPAVVRRAAALFRAVGDPARLALLERLAAGEQCVSEIALATGERLSTVSERLRVLRSEGLVAGRRDGKHVYYAVADAHVADIVRAALQHVSEDA
jgi:ArsR family transcriptional regulator